MYTVLLGTDEWGCFPLLVRAGENVHLDEHVEWLVVARTSTYAEALAIADQYLLGKIGGGGRSRTGK
ncbi:MAG TPA: hypothetical protein VIJ10_05055 [Vicinamibacteria bacterium]|jgi:hypothetical protein